VGQLRKYIDVDVFGKCGKLTCKKDECQEKFNSTYKFYLAVENSICPDYVTEKVFKILDYNIIPVVLNGANMADFLPPKSYIDANSFKTVEELADYLKFLSENPEEYVKYFWWRKHYKKWNRRVDLCKICEKVNDEEILSKGKIVTNFPKFHSPYKCKKAKIRLSKLSV
jgi:alpha-1,3-fucosyltransferase